MSSSQVQSDSQRDSISTQQDSTIAQRDSTTSLVTSFTPLIPTHFQAAIQVIQVVARVCQVSSRSLAIFTSAVVAGSKQLTGATWVELLLASDKELHVCPSGEDIRYSTKQRQTRIPISQASLLGQVFLSKQSRSFSSPRTSSSYQGMQYRLTPFSTETHEPQDTFSVAAIPISDPEGVAVGVLVIFNKIDEHLSRSFFTSNDLALCQELCNVIGAIVQYREQHELLRKDFDSCKSLLERKDDLSTKFTHLFGKKKRLKHVLKAVAHGELSMSINLVTILAKVLEVDAIAVYEVKQGQVIPCIVYGLREDLCDGRAASHCAFTIADILNVKDVKTEPLFSGKDLQMESALCCPVKDGEECVSVIEFYRKTDSFHELDLLLVSQLTSQMSKIPRNRYRRSFPPSQDRRFSIDRSVDWLSSFLSDFSLPRKKETFDYVALLQAVEVGVSQLFECRKCTVLVLDERKNLVWTRTSDSSDPCLFPRDTGTFVGALLSQADVVHMPLKGDWAQKKDSDRYKAVTGICCPIQNLSLDRSLPMGFVIAERSLPFSKSDLQALQIYLRSLSNSFMLLFLDKKYQSPDASLSQSQSSANFLELNIEERVLERKVAEGKSYHFTKELPHDRSPSFELFAKISSIPAKQCEEITKLCAELPTFEFSPYRLISQHLTGLIPCEATRLLIYDSHRKYLVDKETGVVHTPAGLVKVCLQTCSLVSIPENAAEAPNFDQSIDGIGLHKVHSLMIVPIVFLAKEAAGVIVFANLREKPRSDSLLVAQVMAFIARELLIEMDDTFLNWQNVIQTGRRQRMLFKWCGEIFRVLIHSQERTFQCSSLLNRLHRSPTLEDLLSMALETVTLTINCEGARLVLKDPDSSNYYYFTQDAGLSCLNEPLAPIVETAISERMLVSSGKIDDWENSLTHPIMLERVAVGVLQVWNKKDEAKGTFSGFLGSDENTVRELCKELGTPCRVVLTDVEDFTFPELANMLKEQVWSMNNSSFFVTIRQACKILLDCDQALVFIREGQKLVVKAQGNDVQNLVGWSVNVGQGIVGKVAQTRKPVNVTDAYETSDFDSSTDIKRGYRTRSLLCVPVIARGQSIGVLQMTNKVSGFFDSTDLEMLEMFSDVVSGALQSLRLFQDLTDEKNQYTEVLNSLGSTIFVLNADGKLEYTNRPVNQVLTVNDGYAKTYHYSKWLKDCPVLQSDLDAVRDGRMKRAKRKFQSLTKSYAFQDRKYDYRIISFEEEPDRRKIVLVLEEVISRRTRNMSEDGGSFNPMTIQSENTLQTCISKLADLVCQADSVFQEDLESVISTLKSGNLDHTKVMADQKDKDLVTYMVPETVQISLKPKRPHHPRKPSGFTMDPSLMTIELSQLRDWNLNFLEIDNESPYILSIFNDLNFIKHFGVSVTNFINFLSDIKELYSHRGNPFHNYKHGVTVMQNVYCVFSSTVAGRLYEDFEQFGILIAALGHDVDHTGRTNAFEISKETIIALRYHDTSVLEQHHAATLFLTTAKPGNNIFANIDPEEKKQMRKLMIAAIIATDMSKHFTMVENMSARFKELVDDPLGSRQNDKKETAELILHSSDLSNPTKVFELSYKWSSALAREFLLQVREEMELGLPVTAFMKGLDRQAVFLKNEISFYSKIVRPLWDCLNLWLAPGLNLALTNVGANIERLKEMEAKVEEEGS